MARLAFAAGAIYSLGVNALRPLLVFVVALLWLAAIQFRTPHLFCDDSYFHAKMGQLVGTSGPVRDFPWLTGSLWSRTWADSSFLFHVILSGYERVFGTVVGAKWATATLGALLALVIFLVARALACPSPELLTALAMGGSWTLVARLLSTRGYLVSVPLVLLLVLALVQERLWLLALVSVLFPLSYTAIHVVPVLVALHTVVVRLVEGRWHWRPLGVSTAALAAGVLLHPNFPGLLKVWWVQNIWVMGLRWIEQPHLRLGSELLASTGAEVLGGAAILPIAALACGLLLLLNPRPLTAGLITLGLVASLFGALSVSAIRFLEYAIPLVMLFCGALLGHVLPEKGVTAPAIGARAVVAVVAVTLLLESSRKHTKHARGPNLQRPAQWIAAHSPPGAVVVADWDAFAQFFFWNDRNRLIIGMEPTFMLYQDPALHEVYEALMAGEGADLYEVVVHRLGGSFVAVHYGQEKLLSRLDHDPRFVCRLRDERLAVFEVTGGRG
jgi:hypothetical protein